MRQIKRWIIAFPLLSFVLILNTSSQNNPHGRGQLPHTDAVKEIVIRKAIADIDFKTGQENIYFIAFAATQKDHDPPEEFLKWMKDLSPRIKKASDCEFGEYGIAKDKETGEEGILLRLSDVKFLSYREAESGIVIHNWAWGKEGLVFRVALENRNWVIKEERFAFET